MITTIKLPTKLIESVSQIESEFPYAFNYLMSKKPTSISIDGAYISLHCVRSGKQLIYDNQDIKYFNMLYEEVNLMPNEKQV